ncbi:phosphatidylinositol 3-kinase regulatory subunit alpha-like [Serinus canaria]|uniref:phosphatidylinositol 3-kinase regulatory subunit alpha-like n=1 Tax=Serinus canaria TaxID=9135 RepID=UPI0021CCFA2C|nr:phosphatidylinositol 3-kinase regulatory subunit alpha-like [Serinus canaria]
MDLYEAQTLADALKWYLQELPTPLIPPALYSDLVHMAQETPGLEECGQRARALLAPPALPQPQALLLRQLARHFCRLCQGSHRSRLSPRLLGELFGELLLHPVAASIEAGPELRARILESFIMASEVAELPAAPELLVWVKNSREKAQPKPRVESSMKKPWLSGPLCRNTSFCLPKSANNTEKTN